MNVQDQSLSQLLLSAGRGSERDFEAFFQSSSAAIWERICGFIDDDDLRRQIFETTYAKAFSYAPLYAPEHGDPVFWVGMIAREEAVCFLRDNPDVRHREIDRYIAHLGINRAADATDDSQDDGMMSSLAACISRLPHLSTIALKLAYHRGLDYTEISELLGLSEKRVREMVSNGVMDIANCMREFGRK